MESHISEELFIHDVKAEHVKAELSSLDFCYKDSDHVQDDRTNIEGVTRVYKQESVSPEHVTGQYSCIVYLYVLGAMAQVSSKSVCLSYLSNKLAAQ